MGIRKGAAGLVLVAVAAFGLAACGSSKSSDSAASGGDVKVEKQWARTSPAVANAGAAYFTVTASDDDILKGVSVDSSVAMKAEMHETVMAGDMATGSTMAGSGSTAAPAMKMQPVDKIDLPKGKAVELKPGGYHIMLMDLKQPLKVGETFKLTLTFDKAKPMTIEVPVSDTAP